MQSDGCAKQFIPLSYSLVYNRNKSSPVRPLTHTLFSLSVVTIMFSCTSVCLCFPLDCGSGLILFFLVYSYYFLLLADLSLLRYPSRPAEQTNHNSVCTGSVCTSSNTPTLVLSEVSELYLVAGGSSV